MNATDNTNWPEWMDMRRLTAYASVSERTLRSWIHRLRDPLPASQVGGKIRVRRATFDAWMERQNVPKQVDVSRIVEEIVNSVSR